MKSLQELKPKTIILNIEANGLDPDQIWVVTCIDVDTKEEHIFRRPDLEANDLKRYLTGVARVVGHNILNYDWPILARLCGIHEVGVQSNAVTDTLVISRLLDFDRRGGHSLAAWAPALGVEKTEQPPWDAFSEALVDHSMQNCRLTLALYNRFLPYINSKRWASSIELEHFICVENREIHLNGFHFNVDNAKELRYTINIEVEKFDEQLLTAFPPRPSLIRLVEPRITKHGTLNRNDFRWAQDGDLSSFNGGPFSLIQYCEFNPGSPSQIVERLNEAGWKPTEKTKGHKLFLRGIKRKKLTPEEKEKLAKYTKMGWMVSEKNLDTLPETAPLAARLLAKRIKFASRVRTLTEWINSVKEDGRIHGTVNGLGAWTHRCSHDKPNTGNIPKGNPKRPETTPFADEMRAMWDVEKGEFLVGVDAESIQLRVLAHYINDERFTQSLVSGQKEDGTDPHSLNKIALGEPCKSRDDSKTFIYAWLLGAGREQVGYILQCSLSEASKADEDFVEFYPGLKLLKQRDIPLDAARGYFEGFDGRYIKIRGEDEDQRRHFALAGYLQGGEVIVMKTAMKIWIPKLRKERIPFKLVNFVHDEWQTQVPDYDTGVYVGNTQADAIRDAGEILGLRCPMAGSVLSGHGDRAIGQNWYTTH